MVASSTLNYGWPKPDTEKDIDFEFYRLRDETLDAIDLALKAVQTLAEGKAAQNHTHPISAIQGLVDALNGKMAANRTFILDDLGDVTGAAEAPVNYVLVKTSEGTWVASSALAALGNHGHTISQITNLQNVLNGKADASAVNSVLTALDQAVAGRLRYLPTGAALPSSNVGPLWHDDYAGVMTWQTFNANGASFAGYASIDIGLPVLDGQPTPRPGYVKRNGASLSKSTYAALWNWALHNGNVVSLGSWVSGPFWFADNGNGTFRLPDNRGEHPRAWDDGRGVDPGRAFGSAQGSQNLAHNHGVNDPGHSHVVAGFNSVGTNSDGLSTVHNAVSANAGYVGGMLPAVTGISLLSSGGNEARGRNVAHLAAIKF